MFPQKSLESLVRRISHWPEILFQVNQGILKASKNKYNSWEALYLMCLQLTRICWGHSASSLFTNLCYRWSVKEHSVAKILLVRHFSQIGFYLFYLSIHQSFCLSTCLSTCLSVCLSIYLSKRNIISSAILHKSSVILKAKRSTEYEFPELKQTDLTKTLKKVNTISINIVYKFL